jgi:H+-translocating NAD(P) transhydrogenase subunit alpha
MQAAAPILGSPATDIIRRPHEQSHHASARFIVGLTIGVVDEARGGERRVAASPASTRVLVAAGHEVMLQSSAGAAAGWPDDEYAAAGATIAGSAEEVLEKASALLCVRGSGPGAATWADVGDGHTLAGLFDPLGEPAAIQELAGRGATVFCIDLLPRVTRAQPMDVLSSQATVAGYKAVIVAASLAPRLFPMLTYAAGTIPPAKVLILGAGVAGLQAIATARRLGANVSAYDVRAAVREQIESLGARFVDLADVAAGGEDASGYATGADEAELARQREALAAEVAASDVVVTTALVPGQRSPILVTAAAIGAMKPGSVIVDLAAERGGNCEGTVAGKTVEIGGVVLVGAENLAATLPQDASQMLGRNLANFVLHIAQSGEIDLDSDDPIVQGTLVARGGRVVHERVAALLGAPAAGAAPEAAS